ncbi:MAG: hypothetical protein JW781_10395 [Deltaproteobacteria bacterium]|nr:hypothetical protein [Candidatus Anaeroferrophillacea bacterium]
MVLPIIEPAGVAVLTQITPNIYFTKGAMQLIFPFPSLPFGFFRFGLVVIFSFTGKTKCTKMILTIGYVNEFFAGIINAVTVIPTGWDVAQWMAAYGEHPLHM